MKSAHERRHGKEKLQKEPKKETPPSSGMCHLSPQPNDGNTRGSNAPHEADESTPNWSTCSPQLKYHQTAKDYPGWMNATSIPSQTRLHTLEKSTLTILLQ